MCFIRAKSFDASSIKEYIIQHLNKCGIDIKNLVDQCYDSASVMSGKISGLNIQIKEKVPCAIYTHCLAQRLNIVLSNSVAENTNASNFFSIIEKQFNSIVLF